MTVSFENSPILSIRRMGLQMETGPLNSGFGVKSVTRRSVDEQYSSITGKASVVRNRFNEATFLLQEKEGSHRKIELIVRVYDDGLAYRYLVPKQTSLASFNVKEESTEFIPSGNPDAFTLPLHSFHTPYEEYYQYSKLAAIKDGTIVGFPLLLQYPKVSMAFTEADLTDYAGLYFLPTKGALVGHLSPRPDGSGLAVKSSLPHRTPWRVVMLGRRPERLIESNIVANLNPPCAIKDTSWIHPGKTTFPWWNGYNVGVQTFTGGLNTATHEWYIDFCAKNRIPYHSLDGIDNIAWYGGPIVPYEGADITKSLPGLDLPEVLRYAKKKGVGIRLWMNSAAAKAQMERAFPIYEKMGIEGVMVDFFDHDDQETVNLVHRIVELAAQCHLTVTLHNLYKPTGLGRTYPNLMTLEAARNLEYDKWEANGVSPKHELTVPFVRMLAGPVDFHSGSFRNVSQKDFHPVDKAPMTIGTRARQLARYVVYEGALPMVADSPAVYEGQRGLDFIARVPTTWDETRAIEGEVGKFLVIARRKGRDWYLGAMTDASPRTLKVPLNFLDKGTYAATTWSDGKVEKELRISKTTVLRSKSLTLHLAIAGGVAIHFTPSNP